MDHMPEIIQIIRDALKDRLITGVSLRAFNRDVARLKGNDLEDYLQELWDQIPPPGWQNRKP